MLSAYLFIISTANLICSKKKTVKIKLKLTFLYKREEHYFERKAVLIFKL